MPFFISPGQPRNHPWRRSGVLEHAQEGSVRAMVSEQLDSSCSNPINACSINVERFLDADCMET